MLENMTVQDLIALFWAMITLFVIIITGIIVAWNWKSLIKFVGSFKNLKAEVAGQKFEGQRIVSVESLDRNLDASKGPIDQEIADLVKDETSLSDEEKELEIFSVYLALNRGNKDEAASIYDKILKATDNKEKEEYYSIVFSFYKAITGNTQDLVNLEQINAKELYVPNELYYYSALSSIYKGQRRWDDAINLQNLIIENSDNQEFIVRAKIEVSSILHNSGKTQESIQCLKESLAEVTIPKLLSDIEYEIAIKLTNDSKHKVEILTRLIKSYILYPSNSLRIFNIAYKLNNEFNDSVLSYHLYKLIENRKDAPTYTKNNIGAVLLSLGVKGASVKNYEVGLSKKIDLSISNLAHAYLDAGFYDRANEILDKGDQKNENIINTRQRIIQAKAVEESELTKLLLSGHEVDIFLRKTVDKIHLVEKKMNQFKEISCPEMINIDCEISYTEYNFKIVWTHLNEETTLSSVGLNSMGEIKYSKNRINTSYHSYPTQIDKGFYIVDNKTLHCIFYTESEVKEYTFILN